MVGHVSLPLCAELLLTLRCYPSLFLGWTPVAPIRLAAQLSATLLIVDEMLLLLLHDHDPIYAIQMR